CFGSDGRFSTGACHHWTKRYSENYSYSVFCESVTSHRANRPISCQVGHSVASPL
ncbi:hypothetical protein EVAR_71863_1, partial [Eumeta japonica]